MRSWIIRSGILPGVALLACAAAIARPVTPEQPVPTPKAAPAPVSPADPAQAAPAQPAGPSPHILFDKTELDLGDVIHGQDAVATFTYRNTGPAPLRILSAKPG